jgi:hypothetical protein
MTDRDLKSLVARSDFLLDWQKNRLLELIDGREDGDGDGHVDMTVLLCAVDNVLWRTMGVSLDVLPPMDRIVIEQAVREIA